jgi:hypothetical protein
MKILMTINEEIPRDQRIAEGKVDQGATFYFTLE